MTPIQIYIATIALNCCFFAGEGGHKDQIVGSERRGGFVHRGARSDTIT